MNSGPPPPADGLRHLSGLPHRHTSSGHGTGIGDGIGRGIDVAATEGWRKGHDSGAVVARYRHAFGGLSVRFLVGQSVRNPAGTGFSRPVPVQCQTVTAHGSTYRGG